MPFAKPKKKLQPAQKQSRQPGLQVEMKPAPRSGEGKDPHRPRLLNKVAVITGADSGIGRAVALAFAKEGADIAALYLDEHEDAGETRDLVEREGRRLVEIPGDVGGAGFCKKAVERAAKELGRIDILVNNAAEQHPAEKFEDLDLALMERTFRTNIFAYFYMAKAALPHLRKGSAIINTTSVTAYRGSPSLVDYSATKGAIVAFTRSLSLALVDKGIRVNAVAPGPIWTPLIPATFKPKKVAEFGSDVPMGRPGQPEEVAPCYVFLASDESSYISGQVLHPNGGEIVNG